MPNRRGVSDNVFAASFAVTVIAFLVLSIGFVGVIQTDQTRLLGLAGNQTTVTVTTTETGTGPGSTPNPWTPAAPMNVGRAFAAAATLTNGSVLVAGGYAGAVNHSSIASAEMYNPNSNKWTLVASMHAGRAGPLAVTLNNGKVLVTGGLGSQGLLTSCELYDPATNTWTMTGNMSQARFDQQLVLLNDGRVFVVGGGFGGGENNVTEIYDPSTGTWTTEAPQPMARADMIAVKLRDGNILVAGGHTPKVTTTLSEIYDPTANMWTATGPLNVPHNDAGGVLLKNGNALLAGGYTVYNDTDNTIQYLYTSEIFNETTNSWKMTGDMNFPRGESGLNIVLLKNGEVLVPGGNTQPETGLASAELYDSSTGKWSLAGTMSVAHGEGAMSVLLDTGEALAFGGLLPHTCTYCGNGTKGQDLATNSTDLFNPNAIAITTTSSSTTTSSGGTGPGVRVMMPSGVGSSQSLNFKPVNIIVVIGVNNTVTWTNDDSAPHTVTSKNVPAGAASFNSGNMNSGAVFTYTFTVPGTYTYYCEYHPWMQGTVTVISK